MSSKIDSVLKKPWMVALIAIFCCVLWGSASPCIKIGYEMLQLDPDSSGAQVLFAGLRFTLAGFLALLFGSILDRKVLLPRKSAVGKILKLSIFQTSLQYFCLYVGLAHHWCQRFPYHRHQHPIYHSSSRFSLPAGETKSSQGGWMHRRPCGRNFGKSGRRGISFSIFSVRRGIGGDSGAILRLFLLFPQTVFPG